MNRQPYQPSSVLQTVWDPVTGRYVYRDGRAGQPVGRSAGYAGWTSNIGQVAPSFAIGEPVPGQPIPPAPEEKREAFTLTELGNAVRKITPTLLILGIATGAAFAIGGGLVHRFVFKGR